MSHRLPVFLSVGFLLVILGIVMKIQTTRAATAISVSSSADVRYDNSAQVRSVYGDDTVGRLMVQAFTPAHKKLTYGEAVQLFGDRLRFQFTGCSANPSFQIVPQRVSFMIDNRDATAHTFTFWNREITVGAYDFAITTIDAPGTYSVWCDGRNGLRIESAR